MTGKDSHVFAWPDPEDVWDIKCDDIVEVLDEPISVRRGILKFKEHLHSLMYDDVKKWCSEIVKEKTFHSNH